MPYPRDPSSRSVSSSPEDELVQVKHRNALILSAAGEGIYGLDSAGNTTFVNPAAADMLGLKVDEAIGVPINELMNRTRSDGTPVNKEDCPIYAALTRGVRHRIDDEVFWRRDGSRFPVEYTSTPILENGAIAGAVVVFKDITERRRAEQELREAYTQVERMRKQLEAENAYLQEAYEVEQNFAGIVGQSHAIQQVLHQIDLVAPTGASVLITGESGTGKELIARAIHERSERRERPLIRVNCAAIPGDLFESEFFGHARGAFTGALRDRSGRFELADGGTIFLDEVAEIPLELQGKLLRVLQEGQFERVGEEATRSVDVRVIAATNRDLRADVDAGRFREDLYFRLNVFPVEALPLRERRDDIPLLAAHFIELGARDLNRPQARLTHANVRQLQAYHWPGNVRELQNVIERAMIVGRDKRLHIDLPGADDKHEAAAREHETQDAHLPYTEDERLARDRANIELALKLADGRVSGASGAARMLGIKPTTLASRMKALGLSKK